MFLSHPRVKVSIVGTLCDREVACSASDRQGSNFESCVWKTVSSHSSHHPQEVLLAQFSLYVHKGGLKLSPIHFIQFTTDWVLLVTFQFTAGDSTDWVLLVKFQFTAGVTIDWTLLVTCQWHNAMLVTQLTGLSW